MVLSIVNLSPLVPTVQHWPANHEDVRLQPTLVGVFGPKIVCCIWPGGSTQSSVLQVSCLAIG